ncbi:hypothetical protein AHF37_05479 [Paragonimus kellicotti]|nr:hypothetical protein AHF37_05479 [Paragonimus kellicotti]
MSYQRSVDPSVTDFTDRFYGELIAKQIGGLENTLISPLSLFVAMMITWYSTTGQTKQEIGQTLSLSEDTDDYELLQTVGTRLNNFSANPNVNLSSYNRLFLFGETNRNRKLSKELHQLLHAGVTKFKSSTVPEDAREKINNFIERKTEGMITDMLPPGSIDGGTLILLVNAMYFKAFTSSMFLDNLSYFTISQVDEDGATAAAATTINVGSRSAFEPVQFRVDHPFLVMIVYNKSLPAFIGHFVKPEGD